MAKLERILRAPFDTVLKAIENGIMQGSVSATLEDGSDFSDETMQIAVRVFERYSWLGQNRVSLSVTLVGRGNEVLLSGITSGGSQAVFWKINTFGENSFLDKLAEIVDQYA